MPLREIIEKRKHEELGSKENRSLKGDMEELATRSSDMLLPYGSNIYEFKLYLSSDLCRKLETDDFWVSEILLNSDIIYEGELNLAQLIDEIISIHDSNDRVGVIALLSNDLLEIKVVMKNKKAGVLAYSKDTIISCNDVFDLIPEKIKGNAIIGIFSDSLS